MPRSFLRISGDGGIRSGGEAGTSFLFLVFLKTGEAVSASSKLKR